MLNLNELRVELLQRIGWPAGGGHGVENPGRSGAIGCPVRPAHSSTRRKDRQQPARELEGGRPVRAAANGSMR